MLGIASTLNKRFRCWKYLQSQFGWRLTRGRRRLMGILLMSLCWGPTLTSCRDDAIASSRSVAVEQTWEMSLGNSIEGFRIVAGLGDVTMFLRGARVRAPFNGEVQLSADSPDCVFFASPEVPAYLFRFCGIGKPRVGDVKVGDSLGRAQYLHFATMRRQPEGTWTIVEPSTHVLERSLQRF